jgi:hypothetical protein
LLGKGVREAFIGAVVGDYCIVQSESGCEHAIPVRHDGASGASALVATKGRIVDLEWTEDDKDRATRLGAVVG